MSVTDAINWFYDLLQLFPRYPWYAKLALIAWIPFTLYFGWLVTRGRPAQTTPLERATTTPAPGTKLDPLAPPVGSPEADDMSILKLLAGRDPIRTMESLAQEARLDTDRVFNILNRLQIQGLVTSTERDSRHWWRLTDAGRDAAIEPLIDNGAFEAPLHQGWGTGWVEDLPLNRGKLTTETRHLAFNGAVARWRRDTSEKRSGTASLRVEHDTRYAEKVYSTLSQRIRVQPDKDYELRFWVKCDEVDEQGGLVVRVAPSTDNWDRFKVQIGQEPRLTWRELRLPFRWRSRDVDVRFNAEGRVRAWIDDVTVVPVDQSAKGVGAFVTGSGAARSSAASPP